MSKPVGVGRATKDNSAKHPMQRDEWMQAKKIGRPKQVWHADEVMTDVTTGNILGVVEGCWEKVSG